MPHIQKCFDTKSFKTRNRPEHEKKFKKTENRPEQKKNFFQPDSKKIFTSQF